MSAIRPPAGVAAPRISAPCLAAWARMAFVWATPAGGVGLNAVFTFGSLNCCHPLGPAKGRAAPETVPILSPA